MKRIFSTVTIIILLFGVSACNQPRFNLFPNRLDPAYCQNTIDAIQSLPLRAEFPKGDYEVVMQGLEDGTIEGFDVNTYFTVLTHLSTQPGFILDSLYLYEMSGGEPILYVRAVDQPPYRSIHEYEAARYPDAHVLRTELLYNFADDVQIDDTAEGYFEFIALRTMGSQFYQWWHAEYNDTRIICNRDALEKLIASMTIYDDPDFFPMTAQKKARRINFKPYVEIDKETALVRVVEFTRWGGFFEVKYTLSRKFPHKIIQEDRRNLVEYDIHLTY
jgi:hypothetical protein